MAKSRFKSPPLRVLSSAEENIKDNILQVVAGASAQAVIGTIPNFGSFDNKERSLILNAEILEKIVRDHGAFNVDNLVINAIDWDFLICNVDGNPDKINLIKQIDDYGNYFTIGANRHNGFYIVTHYETRIKNIKKLKNLLKNKGDTLDRSGRAV